VGLDLKLVVTQGWILAKPRVVSTRYRWQCFSVGAVAFLHGFRRYLRCSDGGYTVARYTVVCSGGCGAESGGRCSGEVLNQVQDDGHDGRL
jgi:hypothetical protein